MFELYSERARRVIFFARLESGSRGAEMMEVEDLFAALVVEDQGTGSEALLELISPLFEPNSFRLPFKPHVAFLPADLAAKLLAEIRNALPRHEPIPTSNDIPVSPALGQLLTAAADLMKTLQTKQVTPLHLLTVVLDGQSAGVQVLQNAGITKEKVLDAIREDDEA